jgi:DNA polymerase-3 subunit alpha
VAIVLPRQMCTPVLITRLKEIFGTHPGGSNVHLHLRSTDRTLVMKLEDRWKVAPTPALIGDLKALLGPECVPV